MALHRALLDIVAAAVMLCLVLAAPAFAGKGDLNPDYEPTAGCVALALPDLLALLKGCAPGDRLHVAG